MPETPAVATRSPIQTLYREWEQHRLASLTKATDEEIAIDVDRMSEVEARLCDHPAQSAADLACKLMVVTSRFDFEISGKNASALIAEVKRLAGAPA